MLSSANRMWRTFGLIILFGLLVVSVAGNVVFLQEARSSSAEADHLRQRALTAEQQQNALQQRLAQAAGSQELSPAAVPAPSTASPTLATIETQVATIRGLQPKSDVQLKFLDQDALRKYLVDNFNRDYLPTERESDQKLETMLGLLGPNDNLVQLLLQVLAGAGHRHLQRRRQNDVSGRRADADRCQREIDLRP